MGILTCSYLFVRIKTKTQSHVESSHAWEERELVKEIWRYVICLGSIGFAESGFKTALCVLL
jgi:hypothetical protein